MPKRHSIAFDMKLHAASLVDSAKQSIRKVAEVVGLPKSTLHDNLEHYREALKYFTHWVHNSQRQQVRNILLMSLDGITSARGCATVLSKMSGQKITHQKVLSVLEKASAIAARKNNEVLPIRLVKEGKEQMQAPLAKVHCAAFDEIFQKKKPILGFVDPISSFIYLEKSEDRSGDSWEKFLKKLFRLGLNPISTNTDGGQGMLKGIKNIFPNAIQFRDLFHVLKILSKASRVLEGNCYRLILKLDKAVKDGDDLTKCELLKLQMDHAISIFDRLEPLIEEFRQACYFENNSSYVSSREVEKIMVQIIDIFGECLENKISHPAIKAARSYIKSSVRGITGYKKTIEDMVISKFGPITADAVLGYVCPMIEFLDQIQRSYENSCRRKFWEHKLVEARQKFRSVPIADQEEVDAAINAVAAMMGQARKSNSLMEAVNSVIRRYLVTYKSIPNWFCPLYTFYWNHRTFKRGKRKDLKPLEILTGKSFRVEWVDALLEDYPFEKDTKKLRLAAAAKVA